MKKPGEKGPFGKGLLLPSPGPPPPHPSSPNRFDWWGGRAAEVPAGRGKGMLYPIFRGWQGVPAAREGGKNNNGLLPVE